MADYQTIPDQLRLRMVTTPQQGLSSEAGLPQRTSRTSSASGSSPKKADSGSPMVWDSSTDESCINMIPSPSQHSISGLPTMPTDFTSFPHYYDFSQKAMLMRFYQSIDEPATSIMLATSKPTARPSQLMIGHDMDGPAPLDLPGQTPADFLSGLASPPTTRPGLLMMGHDMDGPAPLELPGQTPSAFLASLPSSSASFDNPGFSLTYSPSNSDGMATFFPSQIGDDCSPPSLVSGPSATEVPFAMTRENSLYLDNLAAPAASASMSRLGSAVYALDALRGDGTSRMASNALRGVGEGLTGSVAMDRTNNSARSTGSNMERRARESRERQIENGKRTIIRPKTVVPDPAAPPEPGAKPPTTERRNATCALPSPKTSKRVGKEDKIACPYCQGVFFRGEHEFRRHCNAKHTKQIKKWVCQDPLESNEPGKYGATKPKIPLSKCKACGAGKAYGAYYNAAAHLRRAHFHQKPPRGKGVKASSAGGGAEPPSPKSTWPPMEVLKHWMREVEVSSDVDFTSDNAPPTPPDTPICHLGEDHDSKCEDAGGFLGSNSNITSYTDIGIDMSPGPFDSESLHFSILPEDDFTVVGDQSMQLPVKKETLDILGSDFNTWSSMDLQFQQFSG